MIGDFETARLSGLLQLEKQRQQREGIGTLSERSLHAILKFWADPDKSHHEVPLEHGVADVFDGERVIEIQTGSFSALRPKLERLLALYPVTVIHPLTWHKTLIWVDPETGESSKPRKSPRAGRFWDAAAQLIYIRDLLSHPNLTLCLPLLDMEEYRLADGWSRDGKRGSHRVERVPTALGPMAVLRKPEDYACLLPPGLPEEFTSADIRKITRFGSRKASGLINILYNMNIIQRTGKKGNAYLYTRTEKTA